MRKKNTCTHCQSEYHICVLFPSRIVKLCISVYSALIRFGIHQATLCVVALSDQVSTAIRNIYTHNIYTLKRMSLKVARAAEGITLLILIK